jgi:leucyl aminopeptidase
MYQGLAPRIHAQNLQATGDLFGDPFEVSTLRREDYGLNKCKGEYVDVLQCNNLPSSRTPRGHQFPGAFLNLV